MSVNGTAHKEQAAAAVAVMKQITTQPAPYENGVAANGALVAKLNGGRAQLYAVAVQTPLLKLYK